MALVAAVRLMLKASFTSNIVSPFTGTLTVAQVEPAGIVTVPLVEA